MRVASWILALSVVFALVVGCKKEDHDQPKTKPLPKGEGPVAKNDVPPAPGGSGGDGVKFAKKGGGNIVANIRGSTYRTERKSELRQIGISYTQFCDEYKGANRTLENFLIYAKNFGPIRDAIKDGYYQMNMRAKLTATDIIAYERDIDSNGYLSVMGDGSVRYVPAAEWKTALGK